MKRMTAGDLQALELLMQTTPGFEHFDSGADGILPECRSCRFHRPHWKYQSCVFAECPYCCNPVSTVPFPVSWTVKMKKKQKETQDILSYHSQAAGCSDKARAKASGGRQPIEECGRTGL